MIDTSTVEMHTAGEPVRIVVDGYPRVEGASLLEKRRYVTEHFDHLRRLLVLEPRGHFDMYGVIPVEPDDPEADLAVLFMHNEGYSTMCGHATIALGRFTVDRGIVEATEPETTVRLQVPSGLVTITVDVTEGITGAARYSSVPSFLAIRDLALDVAGLGTITVDVTYGGAFYALASLPGWKLDERPVAHLAAKALP
ncbi:MAG: proline racemase family protein [Acidimicrobiia bacterium]